MVISLPLLSESLGGVPFSVVAFRRLSASHSSPPARSSSTSRSAAALTCPDMVSGPGVGWLYARLSDRSPASGRIWPWLYDRPASKVAVTTAELCSLWAPCVQHVRLTAMRAPSNAGSRRRHSAA